MFNQSSFQIIQQLSEILANNKLEKDDKFVVDIFKIDIKKVKTYEEELIKCER